MSESTLSRGEIGRRRGRDRAILRGIVATAGTRVVSAGASLLTLGIAARSITKEEFGFVSAVVSLWMILSLIDLGLGGVLTTRVAQAHGRDDPDEMKAHVRDALQALTALGAVIVLVGSASAFVLPWERWLGGSLPSTSVVPAVVLMFATVGASMPGVVGIATLTGTQRMATARLWTALSSVATMLAAVVAAAAHLPPWAFVLAIVGCPTLVSLGVTAWVVLVQLPGVLARNGFRTGRITSTMRVAGYYAVMNASSAVTLGAGTLIVDAVLGAGQAAIFSVASRMYAMVSAVVLQSGAQLWPALTEAVVREDFGWARARHRQGIVFVTLATSTASLALIALGRPVARVWVGSALVPSLSLFISLGALTIGVCGAAQAGILLVATERVRPLAAICVANAVVGTAAAVLLTRTIGASGAALGGLISCVCVLGPGVAVLSRRTRAAWPAAGST